MWFRVFMCLRGFLSTLPQTAHCSLCPLATPAPALYCCNFNPPIRHRTTAQAARRYISINSIIHSGRNYAPLSS